jgi:hypothetical protein
MPGIMPSLRTDRKLNALEVSPIRLWVATISKISERKEQTRTENKIKAWAMGSEMKTSFCVDCRDYSFDSS